MKIDCLYLDNFRGFSDSILPLKDVNFFVGENSTGKSSILGLIRLVEDLQSFWLSPRPRFKSTEVDFGNFKDIVSINSKKKSYFRIGMLSAEKNDERDLCKGFLVTFKQREGMPVVYRYTYMDQGKQIDCIYGKDNILYKYQEPNVLEKCDINKTREIFKNWSILHEKRGKGYKVLPKEMFFSNLAAINSLLDMVLEKGEDWGQRIMHFGWLKIFSGNIRWMAPIRSKPKRTYDLYDVDYSPEGEHAPYVVKKYFSKKAVKQKFLTFIKEFGENSGLFNSIDVKNYGGGVTAPFELDIRLGEYNFRITDVGYGISQVLPIIVELYEGVPGEGYFIQQPEIHLHPRAQAALGDIIYKTAAYYKRRFIIETHSDYMIDRFRITCRNRDKELEEVSSQIVFFERIENENKFHTINILPSGEISEEQPKGYREFFLKEQMNILGF